MIRIIMIALIGLLTSCNGRSNTTESSTPAATAPVTYPKDNFKTGEVIPDVALRADAGQTFALYLPKGYSDTAHLPAIVFFDPHGAGSLPLNLYKDLADKYNYILIGSNISKNGMPLDQTQAVAYNLFNEAKTRFNADEQRIAYCGFSGGAKVALLSAAGNPAITKVIYTGAKVDIQPNHNMSILGFAGIRDMNYTDLVMFDQQELDKKPVEHLLVQWKGKHEFPTADVFDDAFVFLNTGRVENYDKKKVTITPEQFNAEQSKKNDYIKAFKDGDLDWWKQEIARLNAKKNTDIMDERLLNFISLACYSIGGGQLADNKLDVAEKILTIYKMADPTNTDCDSMINVLNQKKAMQMGPR